MKLGIFSDIHQSPQHIVDALKFFLEEKVDLLIGAGDISNSYPALEYVIRNLAAAGLPAVLIPGSHETVDDWYKAFKLAPSHIIDGLRQRKLSLDSFDLVLLPGSEFTAGGDFTLTDQGDSRFEEGVYKTSVNDLESLVTQPEKTIIVCHNPPKFQTERGLDYAFFSDTKNHVLPGYHALFYNQVLEKHERYQTKRENRGYQPLTEKIKIIFPGKKEKVIAAHFHEMTHRATNREEKPVSENSWTENLYHLASNLDLDRVAVWETRTGNNLLEVKYKNINLEKFL